MGRFALENPRWLQRRRRHLLYAYNIRATGWSVRCEEARFVVEPLGIRRRRGAYAGARTPAESGFGRERDRKHLPNASAAQEEGTCRICESRSFTGASAGRERWAAGGGGWSSEERAISIIILFNLIILIIVFVKNISFV